MDERLWCRYFAGTLDGSARYWLDSLPPKSIRNFDELEVKFCSTFVQERKFQQQADAIFGCRQRKGESNKEYFSRFNELSRLMPTRDDSMIIAAFTHGLRGGDLFKTLLGKRWRNAEEMLEAVNTFMRQESENAEKLKMEGRAAEAEEKGKGIRRGPLNQREGKGRVGPPFYNNNQFPRNNDRFAPTGTRRTQWQQIR